MDYLDIFFIGVGLSMDAFAVSVVKGLSMKKIEKFFTLLLAVCFGGFQGIMPILGYFLSSNTIKSLYKYSYIFVFVILAIIGINMIRESLEGDDEDKKAKNKCVELLLLGIATSIDALAVGLSFGIMGNDFNISIFLSALLIGCTTFVLSIIGVLLGKMFGMKLKKYSEIAGGIILILIGLKVLLEHYI